MYNYDRISSIDQVQVPGLTYVGVSHTISGLLFSFVDYIFGSRNVGSESRDHV